MTLQDILKVVDRLTQAERNTLRQYLDTTEPELNPHLLPPEERARRLDAAFDAFREGLTPEQINDMVNAMNSQYVEPIDEDGFPKL